MLGLDEAILWPWTVFGCDRNEALDLLNVQGLDWATFDDDKVQCSIPLEALQDVALF